MDKGFLNKSSASKSGTKGNRNNGATNADGGKGSDHTSWADQPKLDMEELVARMKGLRAKLLR